MAFKSNKTTGFGPQAARFMRTNPDGTKPTASRLLGFLGVQDFSALQATDTIIVKEDAGAEVAVVADITVATTVAEVVTILNVAFATPLPNYTASVDTETGRLLLVTTDSPAYIQVYGVLGLALGFGDGIGLKWVECTDNIASFDMPKNLKDFEEIEIESGDGTLRTMIIPAKIKGVNPVLTLQDEDYELKLCIQGGAYDETTKIYTQPGTDQEAPTYWGEFFEKKYDKGTSKRGDQTGYKQTSFESMNGIEGDLTSAAKAWNAYPYNMRATGTVTEAEITDSAYDLLGIGA